MILSRYENARVIPVMDFITYEFDGNKSEFSRRTGISRSTLREQSHLYFVINHGDSYQVIKKGRKFAL